MTDKRRKMDELFAAVGSGNGKKEETIAKRFQSHPIKEAEWEIKNIYYKMLCLVVQYEEEISKEQKAYIEALLEGTEGCCEVEDCMNAAMEIEAEEFQASLNTLKEAKWSVNFALDMQLLIQEGSKEEALWQLADKFMDTLEVNEEEKEYLKLLAGSIEEKSVAKYIAAEDKRPDSIPWEKFSFYAQEFVEGINDGIVISESDELCMICNYREEKQQVKLKQMIRGLIKAENNKVELSNVVQSKKVVLKNLKIEGFDEVGLFFNNCTEVLVENCEFIGGESYLNCNGCEKIEFLGCDFLEFTTRVLELNEIGKIDFEKCNFEECTTLKAPIVYFPNEDELIKVNFRYCIFEECYILREGEETEIEEHIKSGGIFGDYKVSIKNYYVICNNISDLIGCKFVECGKSEYDESEYDGEKVYLFKEIIKLTKKEDEIVMERIIGKHFGNEVKNTEQGITDVIHLAGRYRGRTIQMEDDGEGIHFVLD